MEMCLLASHCTRREVSDLFDFCSILKKRRKFSCVRPFEYF